MSEGKMLREMPTDILLNMQSFLLGEPPYYKMKRNRFLKFIQDKYKIEYDKPYISCSFSFPVSMSYSMRSQNLRPHMINSSKNITRIINFINNFQYGFPDDDFDYNDKDEVERYNQYFELDEEGQDDIDLDYPERLKITLELTSVWRCKYTSEIMGEVEFNKEHEMEYVFETYSKKLFTKALTQFVASTNNFMRGREDIITNLCNFSIDVEIRERDDSEED